PKPSPSETKPSRSHGMQASKHRPSPSTSASPARLFTARSSAPERTLVMRTTIARALVAPAAIALILAGCGNSGSGDTAQADAPEPAAAEADVDEAGDDAPTPTGHGTYTAT